MFETAWNITWIGEKSSKSHGKTHFKFTQKRKYDHGNNCRYSNFYSIGEISAVGKFSDFVNHIIVLLQR